MISLGVLGSGSSGNSAVIRCGDTTVLVDAGLSARQLCLRLEHMETRLEELTAILLTHEHGDHIQGLDVFCRKRDIPVYCSALTKESIMRSVTSPRQWRLIPSGGAFRIGCLDVESFSVPHDAADPLGFVFRHGDLRVGLVSDTGHVTHLVREKLRGVNALFVEANYDDLLLEKDTKRPWATKQRIHSRHGHLSNNQAAELVEAIWHEQLQHVLLGHLSDDCNDPTLACEIVGGKVTAASLGPVPSVACASRKEVTPWLHVNRPVTLVAEETWGSRQVEQGTFW